VFQAEVSWQNQVLGTGKGKSKKEAEIRAASEALRSRLWAPGRTGRGNKMSRSADFVQEYPRADGFPD
jgi:hypothetical protein